MEMIEQRIAGGDEHAVRLAALQLPPEAETIGVSGRAGSHVPQRALPRGRGSRYFATVPLAVLFISFPLYWEMSKGAGLKEALWKLGVRRERLLRNLAIGVENTIILLTSSLTVALSITAIRKSNRGQTERKVC
jgi:hypothetical protein